MAEQVLIQFRADKQLKLDTNVLISALVFESILIMKRGLCKGLN